MITGKDCQDGYGRCTGTGYTAYSAYSCLHLATAVGAGDRVDLPTGSALCTLDTLSFLQAHEHELAHKHDHCMPPSR